MPQDNSAAPDPLDSLPIALTEATIAAAEDTESSTTPHWSPPSIGRARLLVLAAAVLWSTSGLLIKSPWFDGWPGGALACWRAAFAAMVLWPLVRRAEWTWKLIPMTILFAAMNYSFLTSLAAGTAANAIWLQFTGPTWVLVIGVAVFRERAFPRDWLLVAFAAAGVGVILHYESRGASREAVAWGLVSGVCYAGVVLSLRHLRMHDPIWLAAVNHTVTAVLLAPLVFATDVSGLPAAPFPTGMQWPLLAGLGILQMGLPYVLFARGLQRISGHEATGIGLTEPILVPLWTYLAWNERPEWWTLAGGALILTGLALRYFSPSGRGSR